MFGKSKEIINVIEWPDTHPDVMVYRWPESEQATKLWARYFELRRESVAQGGKGEEANKLYAANRAAISWAARSVLPVRLS